MDALLGRRQLLEVGAKAAGAALSVLLIDPLAALAARPRWPSGRLPAGAAQRIVPSQFMPASQLVAWQPQLDAKRLHATGSVVHEQFVDQLHERLPPVGVGQRVLFCPCRSEFRAGQEPVPRCAEGAHWALLAQRRILR